MARVQDMEGYIGRANMFKLDPSVINVTEGFNPRKTFTGIDELAQSIAEKGVLQPLRVRKDKDSKLWLVDGERRLRAALKAGIKEVPCILEDRHISEKDALLHALIANDGEPLTPMERANAYKRLKDQGAKIDEICAAEGMSKPQVYKYLRLAEAPEEIQEAVDSKQITLKQAEKLHKETDGNPDEMRGKVNQLTEERQEQEHQRQENRKETLKEKKKPTKESNNTPPVKLLSKKEVQALYQEALDTWEMVKDSSDTDDLYRGYLEGQIQAYACILQLPVPEGLTIFE